MTISASLSISVKGRQQPSALVEQQVVLVNRLCPTHHAGLWDPQHNAHMGTCAEMCADKYNITRQQMDDHAIATFERATTAAESGLTSREVVPVELPPAKPGQQSQMLSQDESLSKMNVQKLRSLKPYFRKVSQQVPGIDVICIKNRCHNMFSCNVYGAVL